MNRLKAWINESVSILQVHSIWTALLAKQVKSVLYLFSSFLPSFIKKGPNMSTPKFVNGGPSRVVSVGKSAIFCSPSFPLSRGHLIHFPTKLLTTVTFDNPKTITSNFIDCQSPSTMGCLLMTPFNYQGCCFAFATNKKRVDVTEMKISFFQSSSDSQQSFFIQIGIKIVYSPFLLYLFFLLHVGIS